MCAIFGVSFAPGSTVSRRRITKALLKEGEARGTDASGFAFVGADGSEGLYKKDVRGSLLNVATIPKDAVAIIGHTRNATHGSPKDRENNHPIVSPSGDIRLVHNGVITNHQEVRTSLGAVGKKLPDVDSAVIPAVIEHFGLDHTDVLRGYAACAWFDRETGATIHLARFESSPVAITTLLDGSLVFASTPQILATALRAIDLEWIGAYPDTFESLDEGEYLQLLDGEYVGQDRVEFGEYDWRGTRYHGVTSGSASSTWGKPQGTQPVNPTPALPAKPVGFEAVSKPSEDKDPVSRTEDASIHVFPDGSTVQVPEVLFSDEDPGEFNSYGWTDGDYEHWMTTGEEPDERREREAEELEVDPFEGNLLPIFYTKSHDGDYQNYTTMATLVSSLRWHAGLTGSENLLVGPEEGNLRWVNHFADIGYLSEVDSPDGGDIEYSWVSSPSNMEGFEALLPEFVKDGCAKLRSLVGA